MQTDLLRELITTRMGPDSSELDLSHLQIGEFGALGEFERITHLDLSGNDLDEIPSEVFRLHRLKELRLSNNNLRVVPDEIGSLLELQFLDVSNNPLVKLSSSLAKLPLETVDYNASEQLLFPPPEIAQQGFAFVQQYFRLGEMVPQWNSKLMMVGEGGVGKTSLLKMLQGVPFDRNEPTTHGLAVSPLSLRVDPAARESHGDGHTIVPETIMTLKTWDFGGQQIYHATHQFFLTDRSLFLLLWNARLGWEQGRLYYWLDLIQARAPSAPVVLVATHCDERLPDIPFTQLRTAYPQLREMHQVSNLSGAGIPELRDRIRFHASGLPLMGATWPKPWIEAAQNIRSSEERHLQRADFLARITPPDAPPLTQVDADDAGRLRPTARSG